MTVDVKRSYDSGHESGCVTEDMKGCMTVDMKESCDSVHKPVV